MDVRAVSVSTFIPRYINFCALPSDFTAKVTDNIECELSVRITITVPDPLYNSVEAQGLCASAGRPV